MPRTIPARDALQVGLASAVFLVAFAISCAAPLARAAETATQTSPDTMVRITTVPPAIHVETTTDAKKDEGADDTGTRATKRGEAHITIDSDQEDFNNFDQAVRKMPWIIALIFLVVGSIFLTPIVLLVGIIWYKLRKTRLQNEAMLRLAEHGVVSPAQAADALATGASPASVAPQLYQQAVALRKRVAWSDLRKGIILSMIGAAFCLYWVFRGEASWVGLILLFVGVGYMTLWWLEGRHLDPRAGQPGNGAPGPGAGQGGTGVPGSSAT